MKRREPFISRVRLKNYKSIAECDVRLGPLTVLVGPNGSGKSNFLDALAFLGRAVATTPYEAVDKHGGLSDILRRVPEPTESPTAASVSRLLTGSGSSSASSAATSPTSRPSPGPARG